MRLWYAVHIWVAAWLQVSCLKEAPSPASALWPERKLIRQLSLSTVHCPCFGTGAVVDLMAASPPPTGVCWQPHWGLLYSDWLFLLLLRVCIWWMIIKHVCHIVTQHDGPTKNHFIGAVIAGSSISEAACQENIPPSTAVDLYNKYQKTGSTKNCPCSGCPPKVTAQGRCLLVRKAVSVRRIPLAEIGLLHDPLINEITVRQHLAECNYHCCVACNVPYLTEVHKKAQWDWACMHKMYMHEQWSCIIWLDECYIYLSDNCGCISVTCCPDEKHHEDCLIPTFKQSSIMIIIWAYIKKGSKGPLIALEYLGGKGGGMNLKWYQEQVLNGILLEYWGQKCCERGEVVFQQDSTSGHMSKSTKKWFFNHQVPLFPHPTSSPDINPIEPVWHELKKCVCTLWCSSTTMDELINVVTKIWDELLLEDIDKHINGMSNRVQAVLDAKGGHTHY